MSYHGPPNSLCGCLFSHSYLLASSKTYQDYTALQARTLDSHEVLPFLSLIQLFIQVQKI